MRLIVHGLVYLYSLATFLYLIGFTANQIVPSTVDSGLQIPAGEAAMIDVALIALFGVTHTVLARASFRKAPMWKTLYLLVTAVTLNVLYRKWEPIPNLVWNVEGGWYLEALRWAGWVVVLWCAAGMDHLAVFGWTTRTSRFQTPGLYRWVRHPQMSGLIVALWATREMSWGHLLLAAGFTAYIVAAVWWEERDLVRTHGAAYEEYRRRAGMFWPRIGRISV